MVPWWLGEPPWPHIKHGIKRGRPKIAVSHQSFESHGLIAGYLIDLWILQVLWSQCVDSIPKTGGNNLTNFTRPCHMKKLAVKSMVYWVYSDFLVNQAIDPWLGMATKLSALQVGAAPFARALWRVLRTRTIDLDHPELKNQRSSRIETSIIGKQPT